MNLPKNGQELHILCGAWFSTVPPPPFIHRYSHNVLVAAM